MKHDELQEDLASHLRAGTDRMVWTNTQLGPSGSPRPDVFTVNKSFSRFRADAYEVKVSVSDLRSDVTSGKWQSYRKFAQAVWFAFPRGMVPLDLVPKECGIILRSDAGWRAARKPVAQVLDTLPRDAWLKLLMDLHPVSMSGHVREPRRASEYTAAAVVRKKIGEQVGELFLNVQHAEARLKHRRESLSADLAEIDATIEERRKQQDADETRSRLMLDESMQALGRTLGIAPHELTPMALQRAIYELRGRLGGRGIDQAIALLTGLRTELPEQVA